MSGLTEVEIHPQSDGDIELTPMYNERAVPVRVVLWRDNRAAERCRRSPESGYWSLGLEGVIGWHPDYSGLRLLSGVTYGLCLAVQDGRGVAGRMNGCIAGFEEMAGGDSGTMAALVTEPRFRISGGGARRATEFGVVGRAWLPLDHRGARSSVLAPT